VETRQRLVFLCLVLAQGAHSVEEYRNRLYEVFAPARAVSLLVADDAVAGFIIFNMVLVLLGLWCWALPVRLGWPSARGLVWFWTILELANGIGHLGLALARRGYFPGAATAPLLVALAAWMAVLQMRGARARSEAAD
jgi:Protein of unknown function with HXXEE motif